jgi:hypothetical protein
MTGLVEKSRIGGEFEFIPAEHLERAHTPPDLRLPKSSYLWTDLGRSALFIAAASILQRGGRPRAWLPAFACASVSQPFLQAGFDLRYYAGGASLDDDNISLPELRIGDTLLFIHYFGHPNRGMLKATRELHAAGVWIIEDCVQASLAPMLGEFSDFAVTSYRKFLPVVDGAVLISRSALNLPGMGLQLQPPDESFVSAKFVAKILRGANAAASDFLPLLGRTEDLLEGKIVPRHTSWLSSWIMERIDLDTVIVRRRANWVQLSRRIADSGLSDHVQVVFKALSDDSVPLGFPVRVINGLRNDLQRFLSEKEIYCPVHWPLGHLPADQAFERERDLEQSLLTLPVDQRMSVGDVDRLVMELVAFFSRVDS